MAHHVGELRNLTAVTTYGFRAVSVEVQVLHSVALQDKVVLDQLLAAQGGCLSYSR